MADKSRRIREAYQSLNDAVTDYERAKVLGQPASVEDIGAFARLVIDSVNALPVQEQTRMMQSRREYAEAALDAYVASLKQAPAGETSEEIRKRIMGEIASL